LEKEKKRSGLGEGGKERLKKVIKENFKEEKPLWHWFRMGEICN
jgi:hypothetical protein